MQDCGKPKTSMPADCSRRHIRSYEIPKFISSYDKRTDDCTTGFSTVLLQDSDDSDPEIFRVKRRSSTTLIKRSANDVNSSTVPEQQVSSLDSVLIHNF